MTNLKTIDCFGPPGGDNGLTPYGTLLLSPFGHLYGTTSQGGGSQQDCDQGGCGIVFDLVWKKGKGWHQTVLHRFRGGSDGATPVSGVVMDAKRNLFGTTWMGGQSNAGVVYEITP
jgi:hypothetical protein